MENNKRKKVEPIQDRLYLVTGHIGGRTWVLYHGSNFNKALELKNTIKRIGPEIFKHKGMKVKSWVLSPNSKSEG